MSTQYERLKVRLDQISRLTSEEHGKIREAESRICELRNERSALQNIYGSQVSPYAVGSDVIIEWSENVGSGFTPKWQKVLYQVRIYQIFVKDENVFEYKGMYLKKDGSVSTQRFKAGALIELEQIQGFISK